MTPVQASTIPLLLGNKDVIVEAVTGSGKTLAFAVPIIERLKSYDKGVFALILAPTRELALQIYQVINQIVANSPKKISTLKLLGGGSSIKKDRELYERISPAIIVGTPGRVRAMLPILQLKNLEVLILDEADKLLDLGFEEELRDIISHCPKQRRTGLFSATVNDTVSGLVRACIRNGVRVQLSIGRDEKRMPATLKSEYVIVEAKYKLFSVISLLQELQPKKSIVFMSSCAVVDYLGSIIEKSTDGYKCIALHGRLSTSIRKRRVKEFEEHDSVLVTTDVAARGLDFTHVDLVIQMDAPLDPKAFSHRAGRAGRAGRVGAAILLLTPSEEGYVDLLRVRKMPIEEKVMSIDACKADALHASIQDILQKEESLFRGSMIAYVSYIRAYTKHQATSIFRLTNLNFNDIAWSMGLLTLPAMPELKGNSGFVKAPIPWDLTSKKVKETKRKPSSWSSALEVKAAKRDKKLKREKRKLAIERQMALEILREKQAIT